MNAPKATHDQNEPFEITCITDGCKSIVVSDTPAATRMTARKEGWAFWKESDKPCWLCPSCQALRRQAKAAARKQEEKRANREAKKQQEERRATVPIDPRTIRADEKLNRESRRLIVTCEFDRVILPRLKSEPRLATAADEYRRQVEISQGVSDREMYSEKVDGSPNNFGPHDGQIQALRWLALVDKAVGVDYARTLRMAIIEDLPPISIGSSMSDIKGQDERRAIGMAYVKGALRGVADYMGLRK